MTTVDIADPFARKLMAQYLANRQEDLQKLRDAVTRDDFEAVRLTGHNMHGSGSSYGLDRISELGRDLETAAIEHDKPAISELISALESYVRTLHIN